MTLLLTRTGAATLCLLTFFSVAAAENRGLPPRTGIIGEVPVTIEEVIAQVLANNKDIELSRIDKGIAGFRVIAAKGAFDSFLGLDSTLGRSVTPVSSLIGGAASGKLTQRSFAAGPQLSGLLPRLGTSYQVDFSSTRLTNDNPFTTLNPQFPTSLGFSLSQPLVRGLRIDANRNRVEVAKKNESLSDEQFRQRVIEVVTQAAQAYWELVFAYRNLRVQTEAVELARRQLESNERMAKQGILAPIDVVEAQTQLATFEENAYRAQEALTRAENGLKTLMLPNRADLLWARALTPRTPMNVQAPLLPLSDAVNEALANRPELAQVRISGEINDNDSRLFRDQTRPQVDLVASYTSNGLAGQVLPPGPNPLTGSTDALIGRLNELSRLQGLAPLPPISFGGSGSGVPEVLVGSYGQSLSNLASLNFPSAQVGLRFSFPLRNRTAEANLGMALAQGRRIQHQREQLEQLIEADVRNSMQSVESAKARLDASTTARRSAEAQYESEQRKFQAGTSTVFLVVQRQTAMVAARSRELRAQADLSRAVADFDRSTSRTLRAHNINVKATSAGRP